LSNLQETNWSAQLKDLHLTACYVDRRRGANNIQCFPMMCTRHLLPTTLADLRDAVGPMHWGKFLKEIVTPGRELRNSARKYLSIAFNLPTPIDGEMGIVLVPTSKFGVSRSAASLVYKYGNWFLDQGEGVRAMAMLQEVQPIVQSPSFENRGIRILSIDGGGVRGGIISLSYLIHLEQRLKVCTKNDKAKILDYFDLVAGTSAGGILALALMYGYPKDWSESCNPTTTELGMTNEQAMQFLKSIGPKVFREPFSGRAGRVVSIAVAGEMYDSAELELSLKRTFGSTMMANRSSPKCFVTTRLEKHSFLFRNYDVKGHEKSILDGSDQALAWVAARATSAAPFYLNPLKMWGNNFWDGGMGMNNPTQVAIREAHKIWGNATKIDFVLSIGSGSSPIKDWRLNKLGKEIRHVDFTALHKWSAARGRKQPQAAEIAAMLRDVSTDVENVNKLTHDDVGRNIIGGYVRLNPQLPKEIALSESHPDVIELLERITNEDIVAKEEDIQKIIDALKTS
jgi:patatin-like phospholipase/acyl hydrolase